MAERSTVGKMFLGEPERVQQLTQKLPWQLQNMQDVSGLGMNKLRNPYAGFEPLQQEAMRQYQQQMYPSLMSKLASFGEGNSGSYGQMGNQQLQDFISMLNAQKAQYGMQNEKMGLGMTQFGNENTFENFFRPRQQGMLEQIGGKMLNNVFSTGPETFVKMWGGGQGGPQIGQQDQGNTQFTQGGGQGGGQSNPYANMGTFMKLLAMGFGG